MTMLYYIYCRKSTHDEGRQKLSLESQHADIDRMMPHWGDLAIEASLDECRSAKSPGRPSFNAMLSAIERGEASGIIAWHPDRLSRNPADAGRIMQLLAVGKLRDLKFVAYTFENTAEGRFMLAIMLGQATYYSDNLSNRIHLAIRTKLSHGWLPNLPPLGYLNDRNTRTIVRDPDRFEVVQEIWRRMIAGGQSVRELWLVAVNELGLRTRRHKVNGDKPVTLTAIYRILTSPFYAGVIESHGAAYAGKHDRMVTLDEFYKVQALLGRPHPKKGKQKEFPFTGLISCGECGFAVTAEDKKNRFGSEYTYYHCTKRRPDYRCTQPYISRKVLEDQIVAFVESVTLPRALHEWAKNLLDQEATVRGATIQSQLASLDASLASLDRNAKSLVDMRVRELISDEDFLGRRREVDVARIQLAQKRETASRKQTWFEPARVLISFSARAADIVRRAEPSRRRLVLEILGSNPLLSGKKLFAEARKPFRRYSQPGNIFELRATVYEVRTLVEQGDLAFAKQLEQMREVLSPSPEDSLAA
jgi:DNA invertase Pin-like site-specific DNA recombinase